MINRINTKILHFGEIVDEVRKQRRDNEMSLKEIEGRENQQLICLTKKKYSSSAAHKSIGNHLLMMTQVLLHKSLLFALRS